MHNASYYQDTDQKQDIFSHIIIVIQLICILESQVVACSMGSFFTQRFQKLICLHLPRDCFMKIAHRFPVEEKSSRIYVQCIITLTRSGDLGEIIWYYDV